MYIGFLPSIRLDKITICPLIHHDHRTREEKRMLRQSSPRAARGGSVTLAFSFSLGFVAKVARVSF